MKMLLTLLIALAAGSLAAQSQRADTPGDPPRPSRESVATQPQRNDFAVHKVSYDGFVPELVRKKNPLQVINPFAPQKDNEDNVIRDRDNKSLGVKLLTIHF